MLLRPLSILIVLLLSPDLYAQQQITFNNQIIRILQRNCQTCHRPGNVAPFPLLTYADARSRATPIRWAVETRKMPPWKPVEAEGVFEHERTLTAQEIETLSKWVEDGTPEGDPADLPDPLRFPEEWTLRAPDRVVQPEEPYSLDPKGGEVYRCFTMPVNSPQDLHVRGLEVLPGNRKIVHHVLLFVDPAGASISLDAADPGPGYTCFGGPGFVPQGALGGWVPGMLPQMFPLGVGVRVPAGSRIVMQVHYSPIAHFSHPSDSGAPPDPDLTRVGLYLSPVPLRQIFYLAVVNPFFLIPAGASRYEVQASLPITADVDLLSIIPHMHLLGREVIVDARFPDSTTRRLIRIDDWDFEWQGEYTYRESIRLPAGTLVTMRAYYDNSSANPRNPSNPPIPVRWGERTIDEMCLTFLTVTAPGPRALSVIPYSMSERGGISVTSEGESGPAKVGYARIMPDTDSPSPSGLAIFGFRPDKVLVTEAAVAASPLLSSGRIFAETGSLANTGVAIANPNNEPTTVSFFFTDTRGTRVRADSTTIPGNGQIARFLFQEPFGAPSSFLGTFSFTSPRPVSVVALRGLVNERSEFLITTLPVTATPRTTIPGEALVFPHFADSGGWSTELLLVNPTEGPISGTLSFVDPSGRPQTVNLDGQARSEFAYAIPPGSARRFETSGRESQTRVGSVWLTPSSDSAAPSGSVVFSFRPSGVRVTEAGVPAFPAGSDLRLYAEASGDFKEGKPGSVQSGIAIANSTDAAATVFLELSDLNGRPAASGKVTLPAKGQLAKFLGEVPGFESLRLPFQGFLRIRSASPVTAAGLRSRHNERGEFLITTTPPAARTETAAALEVLFPHFANSGGYTTQFILFSGSSQASSGRLSFFSSEGQSYSLNVR